MKEETYQDRFVKEYIELKCRYKKLHKMLVKYDAKTLEFTPTCPIEILKEQAKLMRKYLYVLEVRAEIEKVKFPVMLDWKEVTVLVKDETKYCWCDDEVAGEPQNSIKDTILDYVDNEYNYGDSDALSREELLQTTIEIGHPYRYVPEIDGERAIWNVLDYDLDDEIEEWSDNYMKDVKNEHMDELSDELSKVFQAWEKLHGYENSAYVVMETEQYRISDYIDK